MIIPSQVRRQGAIHYHKFNYDPVDNDLTCIKCNTKVILGPEPKVVDAEVDWRTEQEKATTGKATFEKGKKTV